MADFCTNCARDMGFPEPDIDIAAIASELIPATYQAVLCEGCGMRGVAMSAEQKILIIETDGTRTEWDPEQDRMKMFQDKFGSAEPDENAGLWTLCRHTRRAGVVRVTEQELLGLVVPPHDERACKAMQAYEMAAQARDSAMYAQMPTFTGLINGPRLNTPALPPVSVTQIAAEHGVSVDDMLLHRRCFDHRQFDIESLHGINIHRTRAMASFKIYLNTEEVQYDGLWMGYENVLQLLGKLGKTHIVEPSVLWKRPDGATGILSGEAVIQVCEGLQINAVNTGNA